MKKLLVACTIVFCLIGCSALSKVATLMPGIGDKGISVDAQIGDRENETQLGGARGTGKIEAEDNAIVNVHTSKTDANVEMAENVIVKNYDPWMLVALIAVVTLFVPSPMGPLKRLFMRLTRWRRTTPPQQ